MCRAKAYLVIPEADSNPREGGSETKFLPLCAGEYGQFDALMILEAPDGETVAKIALWIGMQGNLRTTTSRAFTEDEDAGIIAGLD